MLDSASSFKKTNQNGFNTKLNDNNVNDLFPTLNSKMPFAALVEKRTSPQPSRSDNVSNFNNFQIGATYLKENLSKKGRCPICTLPVP
mmetsp:Transcript_29954/g.34324  ORF Transcript_29954/g.34324 Transcript_29954/m.34324 type:complete len:88 (+) Transcript_29954:124-387(+)